MDLCPRCGHMTAELFHYHNELVCYNTECLYNHPYGSIKQRFPYPGFPHLPCPQCGGSTKEPWKRYPACRLCNRIEPNE